jgi:hypothetical protein
MAALFTLYVVNKAGGLIYTRVSRVGECCVAQRPLEPRPPPLLSPQDLSSGAAKLGGNEYLMAASTFHSLHAISKQVAPVASSGIVTVDAPGFTLHCYESPTGLKFFVTARPRTPDVALFLKRVYELYADFALKVRRGACDVVVLMRRRRTLERRTATPHCLFPPLPQNPFYELEMPIRIKLFDHALEAYTRSTGLGNPAPR